MTTKESELRAEAAKLLNEMPLSGLTEAVESLREMVAYWRDVIASKPPVVPEASSIAS